MHRLLILTILLGALTVGVVACESATASSGTTFVQIERLARPGINELLVISQDNYAAFNSIPPSQDLSSDPAVVAVRTEVVAVLSALPGNGNPQRVTDIATAFLPDVMTIDITTTPTAPGAPAYPNGARPIGSLNVVQPIGGRKIEDDVVDISLSVLTDGNVTTDNVAYDGQTPVNPANPTHQRLNGQTVAGGTATFPFLAAPN